MCMKCLTDRINSCINKFYQAGERWLADEILLQKHPAVLEAALIAIELFAKDRGERWHDSPATMDYVLSLASVLAIEYPHPAIDAPGNVSYTQCREHGPIHRHTVCKLGRYINKHFPMLPGDIVETTIVKYRQANAMNFRIVVDDELTAAMIRSIAHSCMHVCEHNGTLQKWTAENHPYKCYSSRLGWGMAIREDGLGEGKARSIVRLNEKTFIRIYGSDAAKSHNTIGDDPPLRDWLLKQGFTVAKDFQGCKIERIPLNISIGKYLAPYIDGETKKAFLDKEDPNALLVAAKGNLSLQNTGGATNLLYEIREGQTQCADNSWCLDADAQTLWDGTVYPRHICRYIPRHDAWYHQEMTIQLNDVWEASSDCCRAIKYNGERVYALREQCRQISYNGHNRMVLQSDLSADYKGEMHYIEQLIQLTGGAKKGQYALKSKTCIRDRDGAILLRQDSGHFKWHLSAEQWEPGLGDRVKLSEYGLNEYGISQNNPSGVIGTIDSAYPNDQYYTVRWDNHTRNSYDENICFTLVETAIQCSKRLAQEREAASV